MVFYKNFLMVVFTANIFMLLSGLVVSYNYWSEIKSHETERLDAHHDIAAEIDNLARIEKAWDILSSRKSLNQNQKVQVLAEWELLKKSNYQATQINSAFPGTKDFKNVHTESVLKLTELQASLKKNSAIRSNKKTQFVIIAVLTVVLGMILPLFLGYLLSSSVAKVREKAEKTVSQVVAEWTKSNSEGKKAFQNPEFWAKAAIISLREWFDGVHTPSGRIAVQMSQLVESEMKKLDAQDSVLQDSDRREPSVRESDKAA